MMTRRIPLNDGWMYGKSFEPEMVYPDYDDSMMEEVRLPHANAETPYNYFDDGIYQFVSCYRRRFTAEPQWKGRQVLLTFEGVAHVASVYLNGSKLATHYGGYTAFTVNLSPGLVYEGENVIAMEVDSRENRNLPPFGNVIDYLTYGGIYREAYIEIKEPVAVEDVFVMTEDAGDGKYIVRLQVSVSGEEYKRNEINYLFEYILEDGRRTKVCGGRFDAGDSSKDSSSSSAGKHLFIYEFTIDNPALWDTEHPNLYYLKLALYEGDTLLDEKDVRFGFRTCEFKKDGFYLNNRKVKLLGLNRHQSYPYVGYAMPKSMQQLDAEILKFELGVNAVRTSHYPQSKHFINRCDELGILVFTEIPGWQHIGDEEWKKRACEQVREMVLQYRNHPSIILWGVRINESQDDDELYSETNRIAHELDPTRQTGGVRFIKKSHLLEDVYTYNDFVHNGKNRGLDKKKDVTSKNVPYLVSEFNGHMYPTKSFDDEEHRLEHALRHARVLDSLFEQEDIAGGFGWCMFDYNTHKDFGSGDRICYHGVMDMFRNPKPAAAVYASQSEIYPVCELSSSMDIGDHPAGRLGEVYAFTNADCIRLYKGDAFIKEFRPARDRFKNLPHPPVIIDDFIGELLEKKEKIDHKSAEGFKKLIKAIQEHGPSGLPLRYKLKMAYLLLKNRIDMQKAVSLYYEYAGGWGGKSFSYRFEAIKNGRVVKEVVKGPVGKPQLKYRVSSTSLKEEETYDVALVRITAHDRNGNRLYYYQEPVVLKASGAIEIIGPKVLSLRGGAAGIFVKTRGMKGEGALTICPVGLEEKHIYFRVEKSEQ
ncbi:MAG: glycoside hydrolase family 2 protein [Clostridiales bacterium]|nr:glycoside hydrolase family 2 protein [Clostridiales bacterium]